MSLEVKPECNGPQIKLRKILISKKEDRTLPSEKLAIFSVHQKLDILLAMTVSVPIDAISGTLCSSNLTCI